MFLLDEQFSSEDSLNSTEPAVAIASIKYIEMCAKALSEAVSVKFHIRLRNRLINKSLCDRQDQCTTHMKIGSHLLHCNESMTASAVWLSHYSI